ncbi:MAG: O-antigen ligase family protein [Ardenticatenaceae bacterium]|nr:O-antigen ligase family protein [Ardenticatenaceae bacterium]MCB9005491.1 O-antigen ligase family protein [Ardenticatenaceae bacterium]
MTDIHDTNHRADYSEPNLSGWDISWLIVFVIFLVGAQQLSIFFETSVAIYGRWIGVGIFVSIFWLVFLKDGLRLNVDKKWLIFFYFWVGWQIFLIIHYEPSLSEIFEDRVARFMLMIAGIGFSAYKRSPRQALKTLNQSYFLLNLLLVLVSFLYIGKFPIFTQNRFTGIFRNPNYLSWSVANVLLLAIPIFVHSNRIKQSNGSRIIWVTIIIMSTILIVAAKTRGAIIAISLVVIFYLFYEGTRKLIKGLVVVLVIGGSLVLQFPDELAIVARTDMIHFNDSLSSTDLARLTSSRSTILEHSWLELRRNPERLFIGSGVRDVIRLDKIARDAGWHDPIGLLHSDGIIGFVFYWSFLLALILSAFKRAWQEKSHPPVDLWIYPTTFIWLTKIVVGSIGDSILIIGHMDHIYFWICAGILIINSNSKNQQSIVQQQQWLK